MPTFTFNKPVEDIEQPILLEEDWYHAAIAATPTLEPNAKMKEDSSPQEGAGYNLLVKLALVGGEVDGRRFQLYLPWLSESDEDKYDGIGMKISDAKMARIANFTEQFGGVVDGTDIMLEENMQGFVYINKGLDQSGQEMRNNIDPFAGFKSVEEGEGTFVDPNPADVE